MSKESKLPKFLDAMKKVLEDERSVILTDGELLIACNHLLKRKDRVAVSTFEFWKSPSQNHNSPEKLTSVSAEMVEDFRETLSYARVGQKMNLTSALMDAKNKNQWGSTWILERKFNDLKIQKNNDPVVQPMIQITASNDEHKLLIQSLMNGEPLQLQPKQPEYDEYADLETIKLTEKSINPLIDGTI
jgi:hypothetical protein